MSWHVPPMVITVSAESDRGPALTGNEHDDNSQFNLTVGFLQSTFFGMMLDFVIADSFPIPDPDFCQFVIFIFSHIFQFGLLFCS